MLSFLLDLNETLFVELLKQVYWVFFRINISQLCLKIIRKLQTKWIDIGTEFSWYKRTSRGVGG